jgi:hypothetical protein
VPPHANLGPWQAELLGQPHRLAAAVHEDLGDAGLGHYAFLCGSISNVYWLAKELKQPCGSGKTLVEHHRLVPGPDQGAGGGEADASGADDDDVQAEVPFLGA